MKILVATSALQGQRASDFCFTEEGEPVAFPTECDSDQDIDGGCGCQRSLAGARSHRATTTVMVAEVDMSEQEYAEAITAAYRGSGWTYGEIERYGMVEELKAIAAEFETGAVLERRRGVTLTVREMEPE